MMSLTSFVPIYPGGGKVEVVSIGTKEYLVVKKIYSAVTSDLQNKGIDQWDRFYPNRFVIKNDLKKGHLFGIKQEDELVGVIVLDTNQSKQYEKIPWKDQNGSFGVIHRLAVHPSHQGYGYGKKLLQFAIEYFKEKNLTSIRLDVYSKNPGAVTMYERAGFHETGSIRFPMRKAPYKCFEKLLMDA